ncbi:MAG: Sel1 domain protein repeat-containing protein [Rhodospirillales bacterium]|nr:Sel1 domain protein repeat-containing protein [Rhodospirillales bacterium]
MSLTHLASIAALLAGFSLTALAGGRASTLEDGDAAYANKDYATALRLLRSVADHGNAEADLRLSGMYLSGTGVPADAAQSRFWKEKAAENGDAATQLDVADMYLFGVEGAAKDVARGMIWLRKAVNRGFPAAELQLAAQYRLGEGVPKDLEQALFWERKAAEGGNIVAQMVMGERFAAGFGVAKDLGQAIAWYKKAAVPPSFYRYRAVTRIAGLEKERARWGR